MTLHQTNHQPSANETLLTSDITKIPFRTIAAIALSHLPELLAAWLPCGRRVGREYVSRNPRREDRRPGSFKINLHSGKWADFATDAKGGDVISLYAYLFNTSQREAAVALQRQLGIAGVLP